MKLLIIVNGRNCEEYVEGCLKSIYNQSYQNFDVVIVDDASDDRTINVIFKEELANKNALLFINKERLGTARCRIIGQMHADKEQLDYDVVVWVDMDDELLPGAFQKVVDEYQDPECWLTYGSMIYKSNNKKFTAIGVNYPRTANWNYVHLRTHRKELIYHLTDEDLAQEHLKAYPDINMLYCMLELAGPEHVRVIKEAVYLYNDYHPNVCVNLYSHSQRQSEKEFASRYKPKQQLKSLK